MMRQVHQTKGGAPGGDCFRAAVASVFDVDLEQVPDFMNDYGDPRNPHDEAWIAPFVDWTRERYGLIPTPVPYEYVSTLRLPLTGIAVGWTAEDGSLHAVVYRDGRFWWNPGGDTFGNLHEPLILWTFSPAAQNLDAVVSVSNFDEMTAAIDPRMLGQ